MKRMYYFIYCSEQLSPATILYYVSAGISERDRDALQFVMSETSRTSNAWFSIVSAASSDFIARVRDSFTPVTRADHRTLFNGMPQVSCSIVQLARWWRTMPHALFNSPSMLGAARPVLSA